LMTNPSRWSIGNSSSSEPSTSRLIQGRNAPGQTHSSVWCHRSAASGRSAGRWIAAAAVGIRTAAPIRGQRPWVSSVAGAMLVTAHALGSPHRPIPPSPTRSESVPESAAEGLRRGVLGQWG
jgi:hypothetical protein